jgi:hypothetical protein
MEDIGPGWKSKPQADYQVCISDRKKIICW